MHLRYQDELFSSTRATGLKESEFSTIGTKTGKGNHNFANVVRALHLTLKWREDYLFFIIYFNQQ